MEKILKRKKLIIMIITFLIMILIYYNLQTLNNIRNTYNIYVKTIKTTYLYDNNENKIGKIAKNITLELNNKIKKYKYFQIKNTPYYIYYEDIKKVKKIQKEKINSNYIIFNKNIETNKKITLYKNNKKFITLYDGISLPIAYYDKNNYYVYYLNNLLKIKKDNNLYEIEMTNTITDFATSVSVLYYEAIENICNDSNCTTIDKAKEQIKELLKNNFYTLTKKEYEAYLNGYIKLKKNAVFITTSTNNDYLKNIENELKVNINLYTEEDSLKFVSTNTPSKANSNKEEINRYQIKSNTTKENIIKMANGENIVENSNNQEITVLNYHFFYDQSLNESCDEIICLEVSKFREQLEYLKNNNYKTLTMSEFKKWMYGEIELPTKSVLITIDDGAMGTGSHNGNKLIPLLEEYKIHATLFLIAGWWDINNYNSPYLEIQSHSYDMHKYGTCNDGQLVCATYEDVKSDLEKSLSIIGNNNSFCYPFYSYNETAIQAIKDTGFKLAFIGGNKKASRNNNKYLIPRYVIHSDITLDTFIKILN
jgi:peptidoglycan/xylan/chitin deacetylase (PgdA/CDA1 family)